MVTSKQIFDRFGDPTSRKDQGKYMVVWDVPEDINRAIPTVPNRIYCHVLMVKPLEQAFRNVVSRGLAQEIKTWDGCFNVRKMRGINSQSLHSWGMAIDINAAWNGLGKAPTMSKGLVKCFTDAGLEWGGSWSRPDGMHFQIGVLP